MPQPLDIIYRVCKKVWYLHKRSEGGRRPTERSIFNFFRQFFKVEKIVEKFAWKPCNSKEFKVFQNVCFAIAILALMASLLQNTNWTFCRVSFSYEISSKVWPSDVMKVFATCCMQILMRLLAKATKNKSC